MRDGVLALELSTVRGSVAVVAGGAVLYEAQFEARRSHNAQVFGPLKEALAVAGDRLRGIVVGTGPGSYTGVRIAIAAAQGVGLSRCLPLTGLSSLIGCLDEANFGAVGNARRGRLYVARIQGRRLLPGIQLVKPEDLGTTLEATGIQRWVTCDDTPPLPELETARPCARRLAALGCGLDFEAIPDGPLEPIYLEGAFITQARKR